MSKRSLFQKKILVLIEFTEHKALESNIMSEFWKGWCNFMSNYAACSSVDKLNVISLHASGYKLRTSMSLLQLNSLVKCSITHVLHKIIKKFKYKQSYRQKYFLRQF